MLVKALQENKSMVSACEKVKSKMLEMKEEAAKWESMKAKAITKHTALFKEKVELEKRVKALEEEKASAIACLTRHFVFRNLSLK